MTALLPVLAAEALTDECSGDQGLLVAARRGRVLHAVQDHGQALTPTGRVRPATRPLCGRRPRTWRPVKVDGRRLCAGCERAVRAQYGEAALATAATWLLPDELARTILTAPDLATVNAARGLLLTSGLTGKCAVVDGHPTRLTALFAQRRNQLDQALRLTTADHAWMSGVKNAPARRYPRRVS